MYAIASRTSALISSVAATDAACTFASASTVPTGALSPSSSFRDDAADAVFASLGDPLAELAADPLALSL